MSATQILMSRKQVEELAGIGRSTIYKMMAEGRFPRPVKISEYGVRWIRSEVEAWIESRPRTGEISQAA